MANFTKRFGPEPSGQTLWAYPINNLVNNADRVAVTDLGNNTWEVTLNDTVSLSWYVFASTDLPAGLTNTMLAVKFLTKDNVDAINQKLDDLLAAINDGVPGDFAITFQTNVPYAKITIHDDDGVAVRSAFMDGSGAKKFNLDAGDYTYNITATGYEELSEIAFTVDANETLPITLVALTLPTPTSPQLCIVAFNLSDGEPIVGAKVRARLETSFTFAASNIDYVGTQKVATTDNTGQALLELIKLSEFSSGGVYLIEIFDSNNQRLRTQRAKVPNQQIIDSTDLIPV